MSHESLSRTNESQLKKKVTKIENAWAFMQPDSYSEERLQTSVLQYTEFEIIVLIIYRPSILKQKQD